MATGSTTKGEISTRVLACLLHQLTDEHGEQVLTALAKAGKVEVDDLLDPAGWLTLEQLEAVLRAAREHFDSDRAFEEACCYRFGELQAPPKVLAHTMVPATSYKLATRMSALVTTIGRFAYERLGPGHVKLTYRSDKPETTKLVCLTRRATMVMGPTLWNLPRAQVTEHRCISNGDDACEYDIRFFESRRGVPALLGLLVGGALAAALFGAGLLTPIGAVAVAVLGAAVGWLIELRRVVRANAHTARRMNDEFLTIALEEARTRQELAAFEQREREWSRVMEEQLQERTAALADFAAKLDASQEQRATTLRSFSHDLRNPLAVMRASTSLLQHTPELGDRGAKALEDVDEAVSRMDSLLEELMKAATSQNAMVTVRNKPIAVDELAESLRRRLSALAYGRPIRTFVTVTRNAPESIVCDPLLLDRVIDNLLTNAAKYTDKGRIDVELDGSDEFLSIQVADTGRGIGQEDIARAFHPEGLPAQSRTAKGFGVGLSVVVQLLDQIGGRLEVMSRPDEGTTFWVHVPHTATATTTAPPESGGGPSFPAPAVSEPRELLDRVVTIRKSGQKPA
ncbi:MAG: HAMP domain-containing histidine kinase [Deltaproteobacteria bacterium]|jgi:signal transduction histidine kinase|nr:HAMP domain-containing histidine kinase [Deltaproteobacteria bacterium]MBW2531889.1 HAMP domain-containing histidine kinase [Deltaproteobacteria bacterium]